MTDQISRVLTSWQFHGEILFSGVTVIWLKYSEL